MGFPGNDDDHDKNKHDGWFPRHQTQYDVNSRIMLAAIISLCAVILLVIALHIYARYVLRRHSTRSLPDLRRLRLSFRSPSSDVEQPKTGLAPSVISALPVITVRRSAGDPAAAPECAVCLSGLEEAEPARLLPNCNHAFHVGCIDTWLSCNSTCPMCRTDADPAVQGPPPVSPKPEVIVEPTAPLLEGVGSEGTSSGSGKDGGVGSASSRLGSLRRILSREISSRRIQPGGQDDEKVEDIERQ